MPRLVSFLAVLLLAVAAQADGPPDVADLVKQLGDPKFAAREAAQKELEKRGEFIVPELDRLTKGADAETAERIAKVRYAVVGYKDDIRRYLTEIQSRRGVFNPIPGELNLPADLRFLIADHQPGSGDLLIALATDTKQRVWYVALHMLVQAWDLMTPEQLDRFLRQTVTLRATHRPKYPARVPASIGFGSSPNVSWAGWPNSPPKGFTFSARTTRYLDGKPFDKPFEHSHPWGTVGRIQLDKLAEGKHTIYAVMEYEITQNGKKKKGEIRSKESTFEIVAADAPDELIGTKSKEVEKAVHEALSILSYEGEAAAGAAYVVAPPPPPVGFPRLDGDRWRSQVTWKVDKDTVAGIHCPVWELRKTLPIDLCFDVEIQDLKTGKAYPANPIVLLGEFRPDAPPPATNPHGFIAPRDPQAFAKGREGFVSVRVILKPSRALALTDLRVTKYFPEQIEFGELKMKVFPKFDPKTELQGVIQRK